MRWGKRGRQEEEREVGEVHSRGVCNVRMCVGAVKNGPVQLEGSIYYLTPSACMSPSKLEK